MNAAMQPNYRGYPLATHHRPPVTPRRGVPIPGGFFLLVPFYPLFLAYFMLFLPIFNATGAFLRL